MQTSHLFMHVQEKIESASETRMRLTQYSSRLESFSQTNGERNLKIAAEVRINSHDEKENQ
jgi:hypothetical protein